MPGSEGGDLWYPTVDDILLVHEDIISEDPDADQGVPDRSRIEFALARIKGEVVEEPSTIHEKAFELMRLIASNHWFVDGNKRTALNVTELFYMVNGYEFEYGDDFRSMLKLFAVREDLIDKEAGPEYFEEKTSPAEVDVAELDPWKLLLDLLIVLVAAYSDEDAKELLSEEELNIESVREEFDLTTKYGTTVNIEDDQTEVNGH